MSRPNWIGKTLNGRYKIQEILGQGGMSAVYKALDPNLQRVVAVKMIHSHLSEDPKFISRFEEEARSVAQLRHPNITQVFDFNHDGDTYYMVQEFVPGETLQERLRRLNKAGQRLPLAEAIRITIDVCSAMGYAHDRGMIHRDIKPANIMLDVQSRAILMDFGIVKIVGSTSHTTTGAVVGTAMYMSPDVIRGEAPDARSDIYSLGVTLFEMVSGRPPFQADSAMTLLMMHLHDPLPNLRELRSETPDDLVAVIDKALAKGREGRFNSAKEMGAALKRILDRLEGGVSSIAAQVVQAPPQLSPNQAATRLAPSAQGTVLDPEAAKVDSRPANPVIRSQAQGLPGYTPEPAGPTRMEAATPPPLTPAGGYPAGTGALPEQPPVIRVPLTGATGVRSTNTGASTQSTTSQSLVKPALWAGGGIVLAVIVLCLIAGGVGGGYLLNRSGYFAGAADTPTVPATATPTQPGTEAAPVLLEATASPTSSSPPTPTAPDTTPTPRFLPTVTVPAGVHYARINTIELDGNRIYNIYYETFEYTAQLPGEHVHFFFNTVPLDQAGSPGKGPWKLYGGPSPFTEYTAADRPPNATQMCILVANPDHSIQPNTGNCLPLPDIPTASMRQDTVCRAGPGEAYATVAPVTARTVLLVRGLSADEAWWVVQNPQNLDQSCWVASAEVVILGDINDVPIAEAPPVPPAGAASTQPSVQLTGVTIDGQNRYVVEFVTQNFSAQIPGTHIHFFFNTVPVDQVGLGGSGDRLMFGAPSPFTGYTVGQRPPAATQMCAVVVNPDHSVIPGSGNCFDLPATP